MEIPEFEMKQVEEKRIVLCADDFGMNPSVNDGIVALAGQGRLSATSCLVQGPSFVSGLAALRASGLETGLHLNFTEPMGNPGLYRPVSSLIIQSALRRLAPKRLHAQVCTQLDLYEQAFGAPPVFIDGHQHVHQFAQLRDVLLRELARRYPDWRPYLRNTSPGRLSDTPVSQQFKAYIIAALGGWRFASMAQGLGYPMNRAFLGVYDFTGGQASYAALLKAWLSNAQSGDMIMCHPAASVAEGDGLAKQRLAEFRVLASPDMGRWMQEFSLRFYTIG